MKKSVLILFLIICMSMFQVAYAEQFELTADSKTAKPGEEVGINLTFSNNTGLIAALFEIEYDRERLELINAQDKKLLKGGVFSNSYETYPYIMVWNSSSAKNFTSDGTLAELTFKVLEDASGGSAFINVSYDPVNVFDANLKKVDIHISNGAITVLGENTEEDKKDDTEISSGADNDAAIEDKDDSALTGEESNNDNISGKDDETPKDEAATKDDAASENDTQNKDDETENIENNLPGNTHHTPSAGHTSKPVDAHSGSSANDVTAEDEKNETATAIFNDVSTGDWFYDAVLYVNEIRLMKGVSDTHFAPHNPLTRGMLVTVIYRCEGAPKYKNSSPFSDVEKDAYYANAVSWAYENGIVNGYSDTEFAPDINISREQMASVIHRYATYKGYEANQDETVNISSYEDYNIISEYALSAVQYVADSKIMNGKSETLFCPEDNATRAETAAILQRFIENNR